MTTTTTTAATEGIEVGDIWYSSGGYDQTNVEFYRVCKVTRTMLSLEKINTEIVPDGPRAMSGKATPDASWSSGRVDVRRKVRRYSDQPMVVVENYAMGAGAYPYDGVPKYVSWYA